MKIFRGFKHPGLAPECAVTIGNFDGVHRGHQAMLALLSAEAAQRGIPTCVLTFEPHPRDFFAEKFKKPELAPARVGTPRKGRPAALAASPWGEAAKRLRGAYLFIPKAPSICSVCFCICSCIWVSIDCDCST